MNILLQHRLFELNTLSYSNLNCLTAELFHKAILKFTTREKKSRRTFANAMQKRRRPLLFFFCFKNTNIGLTSILKLKGLLYCNKDLCLLCLCFWVIIVYKRQSIKSPFFAISKTSIVCLLQLYGFWKMIVDFFLNE